MKSALVLLCLTALSCGSGSPPDDHVGGQAEPLASGHNPQTDPESCPLGGGGAPLTHLVQPVWPDAADCTDSLGRTWPKRCAACDDPGASGGCRAICTSSSNRCTIRNSDGVCTGPDAGSTARGCDSVQSVG